MQHQGWKKLQTAQLFFAVHTQIYEFRIYFSCSITRVNEVPHSSNRAWMPAVQTLWFRQFCKRVPGSFFWMEEWAKKFWEPSEILFFPFCNVLKYNSQTWFTNVLFCSLFSFFGDYMYNGQWGSYFFLFMSSVPNLGCWWIKDHRDPDSILRRLPPGSPNPKLNSFPPFWALCWNPHNNEKNDNKRLKGALTIFSFVPYPRTTHGFPLQDFCTYIWTRDLRIQCAGL